MTGGHWALIVVINLVFGLNLVLSKIALAYVDPLTFTAIRFAMVAVLMAGFLRIDRSQLPRVTAVAFSLGAVHFALSYIGLSKADDVATVGIALQLVVPLATLLSIVFLGERVGWRRSVGILLAFSGVVLISFDARVFSYAVAFLWIFGGAVSAAIGTVLMKTLRNVGVFQLQGWIALITTPCLAVSAFFLEEPGFAAVARMPAWIWGVLLFSGIGTSIIGHGGFYYLLQRYEIAQVAPLTLAAPVVTVFFGVMLLDEVITIQVGAGALVTLGGVLILVSRSQEPIQPETESAVLTRH
jgi:O-acetylserine/cysteine efflux transporter